MGILAADNGFFAVDLAGAITAFAALVTTLVAVVALRYAHRQLVVARDSARIDLTFRLYEHQLTPEFAEHIAISAEFLSIKDEGRARQRVAERRWRDWTRMSRKEKATLHLYLNYLETIGGMYDEGRLDKMATMNFFGVAAEAYWRRGDWFIARLQAESGPSTYEKWAALAEAHRHWSAKEAEQERLRAI